MAVNRDGEGMVDKRGASSLRNVGSERLSPMEGSPDAGTRPGGDVGGNDPGATPHLGLPVSGYKPQTRAAVDEVNRNKELEERVLRVLDGLRDDASVDGRWLAIGRTHIEQGFMAVNRAIFRPERVKLQHDIPPKASHVL